MTEQQHKLPKCQNCGLPFKTLQFDDFCPNCGQKNTDNRFTLFELFKEFGTQLLAFDSKFFNTLKLLLLKPGFLSKEFNIGKRIRYMNPVRLLLLSSLVFFALLSLSLSIEITENGISFNNKSSDFLREQIIIVEKDTVVTEENDEFLEDLKDGSVGEKKIEATKDTIVNNQISNDIIEIDEGDSEFFKKNPQYEIALNMLLNKEDFSVEEILDSTKIKHPVLVLGIRQVKKLKQNGTQNLSKYFFQQMSITIFLLIPFFALIFKLIYWRRKIFYINHLVFLVHFHSAVYCILSLGILASVFLKDLYVFIICLLLFFFYKSLRNVYEQGRIKTFIKYFILLISYIFLISSGMLATLFISFFLF